MHDPDVQLWRFYGVATPEAGRPPWFGPLPANVHAQLKPSDPRLVTLPFDSDALSSPLTSLVPLPIA